jgi:hypothetical protein
VKPCQTRHLHSKYAWSEHIKGWPESSFQCSNIMPVVTRCQGARVPDGRNQNETTATSDFDAGRGALQALSGLKGNQSMDKIASRKLCFNLQKLSNVERQSLKIKEDLLNVTSMRIRQQRYTGKQQTRLVVINLIS